MFGLMQKKVDVREELERRKSQSQRILELLKNNQHIYTYDLQKIAYKYSSRLDDLKKDGHRWLAEYEKPGVFRYTYKGQVED